MTLESPLSSDANFMQLALAQARQAAQGDEIPIGAVVVHQSQILSQAANRVEKSGHALHHAEILALEQAASRLGNWRLADCTLYVTLEPCLMCLGALFRARISRLVVGCLDDKRARSTSLIPSLGELSEGMKTFSLHHDNHNMQITIGVCADESKSLLLEFFNKLRR